MLERFDKFLITRDSQCLKQFSPILIDSRRWKDSICKTWLESKWVMVISLMIEQIVGRR